MKVINAIYKFSKFCIFLFMAVMTVVLIAQIFSRSFLGYSFKWAEELARILLVWTTFIGASVAYRDKALAAFDMLERKLSGKWQKIHALVMQIFIIIFCAVVMVYGYQLMNKPIILNQTTPTLKFPMYILYSSVPIGLGLIILYSLLYLKEIFQRKPKELD